MSAKNWLLEMSSKQKQPPKPKKPKPKEINQSTPLGEMWLKAYTELTNPNGIQDQDIVSVITTYKKDIAIADAVRLSNGEKCGLHKWRVVKGKNYNIVYYHPMGPAFNTWDKVIEFTNCCTQVSIASAIAIYKGFPFGWEAYQKDGILSNNGWRYVGPDKKEYLNEKGKGGALEASKMKPEGKGNALEPAITTARAVSPEMEMFHELENKIELLQKENKRKLELLQEENKRLGDVVAILFNKMQKMEEITE